MPDHDPQIQNLFFASQHCAAQPVTWPEALFHVRALADLVSQNHAELVAALYGCCAHPLAYVPGCSARMRRICSTASWAAAAMPWSDIPLAESLTIASRFSRSVSSAK